VIFNPCSTVGKRLVPFTADRTICLSAQRLRTHAFKHNKGNAAFFIKEDRLLIEDWI
jgi:hypothetical protein